MAGLTLAAMVSGRPAIALLGFTLGAGVAIMLLRADPRARRRPEPERVPPEATKEPWTEIARTDVFPSTVGLALLTTASPYLRGAARGDPRRNGGDDLGGLEVTALERLHRGALYVERRSRRLFVER